MKRIGFLSLVVAGMVGCQADRSLPPGPSADIQDANHLSGNSFFFWLPPMINQQAPASQLFSKDLTPAVTITDRGLAGATSTNCHPGNTVRTFSGSDITRSSADYHMNWRTDQDNLFAECTYRITVSVGSTQLGYADVDVVSSGKQLKNVDTDEFIPLLDDRTLPIKFFAGVGALCGQGVSDCGEGTARPGQNSTIVTASGRAGVFIPAGAVNEDVTITVASVDDDRSEFDCIPNLSQQFSGASGSADNACYDYHAEPVNAENPGIEQTGSPFHFNSDVTVGICPDAVAMNLDHATLDLIQIFQFDNLRVGPRALENVPAPFLRCDPHYSPSFGSRRSIFNDLANVFAKLISPQPLFASTRSAMFDLGAGGSTDGFSRFTWALPVSEEIR